MAYQNRIEMTAEILIGLTNRVSSNSTRALKIFEEEKQLFLFLQEVCGNLTIQRITQNAECVPGIPGTQYSSLEQITKLTFSYVQNCNLAFSKTARIVDLANKKCLDSSTKMDNYQNDMNAILNQIDLIKGSIHKDAKTQRKILKYQKSIESIVTEKTKIKKPTEVMRILEKVYKIRTNNQLNRKNFLIAAEKCLAQISKNSKNIVQVMKNNFEVKKELLSAIITTNSEIIENCKDISNQVMNKLNMINFQKNFQEFIDKHKIIRYDIIPDEFKPLDFNHQCFANITTISNVISLQLYPFAMARVKKEFTAKDNNELSIQKGKMVLLMEDLSLPWAYVQNPYTKIMGYAPSSFLEQIGNGLGVILNDFTSHEEFLHKGDYIAIVGYMKAGSYNIRTISDNSILMKATNIGIISEF